MSTTVNWDIVRPVASTHPKNAVTVRLYKSLVVFLRSWLAVNNAITSAILPRDTWGVEAVAVVVIAVSIIILIRSFVTNVVII